MNSVPKCHQVLAVKKNRLPLTLSKIHENGVYDRVKTHTKFDSKFDSKFETTNPIHSPLGRKSGNPGNLRALTG